jgi:hypothetical protein
MVKVVPASLEVKVTSPPWRRAMASAMGSPSPVPPYSHFAGHTYRFRRSERDYYPPTASCDTAVTQTDDQTASNARR